MEQISTLFGKVILDNKKTNLGERHLILGEIAKKFNENSYKKLANATIATFLSPYDTQQLYAFHRKCTDSKNYAAMFWWHVKS